jgi:uncharacterized protein (TIRG00374 family)
MKSQKLKLILGGIVGCILLVIWLSLIDLNQVFALFTQMKPMWLLITSAACIGQWVARSMRWRTVLHPVSRISMIEAFNLYMAGTFINFMVPVRIGELSKSIFLKQLNTTPISKSLPTIFIDKVIDFSPIALVLVITPFMGGHLNRLIYTLLVILLLIFTLFLSIIILSAIRADIVVVIMRKCFFWLPLGMKEKIITFLELFIAGMSVIRAMPNKIVMIFAYMLIAVSFDSFFVWSFFHAFGLQLPWLVTIFCAMLLPLFFVFPSPPAAIGSQELIYVFLFSITFGYDRNITSAVAIVAHLLSLFLLGVFGFIALGYVGMGFSRILGMQKKLEESEG